MPNAVSPDHSWLGPALGLVLAITAARIGLLALSEADLFVDEAQYWLWGQDLAPGYYSKPPLIAWVIRGATELAGSDAPFWVRLPAPLFHAATALILGGIAARLHSARAGVFTAATYATLPMVAVGSLLISTDSIMFPFLAGALALYLPLVAPGGGGRPHLAALVGLMLGLAFLAKYAALYYLVLGALAALHPRARPDPRDGAVLLVAFALAVAPNIAWNAANGLATLSHTVDNTGWRGGLALDPAGLAGFLGAQFLVAGPVVFAALVLAALGLARRGAGVADGLFAALSLPILALVSAQALISGANANWAAATYLAGVLLAVPWLLARRAWLVASFAINATLALALPLAATQAESLRFGGRLILARYVGIDELSRDILALAEAEGAAAIVASGRALLADLHYTGRASGLAIYAWPHVGPPRHHYEQRYPYPGTADGTVLAVLRDEAELPCVPLSATPVTPGPGAYEGEIFTGALVPADCWGAR
jgi:4-amino-4-deoxy-L-arabinose transferase-like glycosyltransferase